jgi:alcohol dehydrogenase (NADP+)
MKLLRTFDAGSLTSAFAEQFSKALGADTYALTHSASKEKDALELGATKVIVTKDQKAALKQYAGFFDIIICTSFQPNMPLSSFYFPLLKPRGQFILNGLPEEDLPPMKPQSLLGKSLTGSLCVTVIIALASRAQVTE